MLLERLPTPHVEWTAMLGRPLAINLQEKFRCQLQLCVVHSQHGRPRRLNARRSAESTIFDAEANQHREFVDFLCRAARCRDGRQIGNVQTADGLVIFFSLRSLTDSFSFAYPIIMAGACL